MSPGINADQLRDLFRQAKALRTYMGETKDPHYVALFDKTATALEDRAHRLAHGTQVQVGSRVDIVC